MMHCSIQKIKKLLYRLVAFSAIGGLMVLMGSSSLSAQTTYKAQLSGRHEVSPVTTRGSGMVSATLDGDTLVVTGSFDNLSSSFAASHIHMAMVGTNGAVEIPLDPTIDSDEMGGTYEAGNNTFELTAEQKTALQERRFYVNVHSANHPAGELRGQLHPQADAYFYALASGTHSMPAVKTRAHGAVAAELNGDMLTLTGSFKALTSAYKFSHLHMALAGTNGGVEIPLNATVNSNQMSGFYMADSNSYQLSSEQMSALQSRKLYVNIHSENHPAGEIRGQLVPPATATFYAQLSGSAEVPSVNSSGKGAVLLELRGDTLMASGSFADLGSKINTEIRGGAHLHGGFTGQNAGINHELTFDMGSEMKSGTLMASDNMFKLSADQMAMLMKSGYYVNVHTMAHAPGEIRGQALPEATAYFTANLSGNNEVQPVNSSGSGQVNLVVNDSTVMVTGAFMGLNSAYNSDIAGGSHLHMGPIDGNGGIQVGLNPTLAAKDTAGVFMASDNTMVLSQTNLDALYNEGLYVNVHTMDHAPGEIRGQTKVRPNALPGMPSFTSPDDGTTIMIDGSADNNVSVNWSEASDSDDSKVVYIWQLSSDSTFTNIMANMNVGTSTQANLTYGKIDTMLMNLGLDVGTSQTFYHRVMASDGSEHMSSEVRSVTFERGTVTAIPGQGNELPEKVTLKQNYPNPFNPTTQIQFALPQTSQVRLTVYNELGRKVSVLLNKNMNAGYHTIDFDGSGLASGLYIYRLRTPQKTIVRKMMLLK